MWIEIVYTSVPHLVHFGGFLHNSPKFAKTIAKTVLDDLCFERKIENQTNLRRTEATRKYYLKN